MADEPNDAPDQAIGDTAPAEPVQFSEVEQLASEMGWKPKDQFQGPEEQWRPAPDFIRKAPGARDLKREIKRMGEQMDRMAATNARTTDRLLKDQQEKIEAKYAAAVEAKDGKAIAEAFGEMQELTKDAKPAAKDTAPERDFAERNPWYGKDSKATRYAVSLSQDLAAQGKTVEEQLEGVEREMREVFPNLYSDAPKPAAKPSAVAAPSRGNGAARPKGVNDLPAEARKAAENLAEAAHMRFGKEKKAVLEQYAKDYWDNVAA